MRQGWRSIQGELECRVVDRQDATSCLLFAEVTLPTLLLLWGTQCWAAQDAVARALFRPDWLAPSLWAQGLLMAWLVSMGALAWSRRRMPQAHAWLVQLTVVPGVLGVVLLALAFGLKDTPMSMVVLAEIVFARALFSLHQLRWAFTLSLLAVVATEAYNATGVLPYAPLLVEPVYVGGALAPWWAWWLRVVFSAAVLPLSWVLFFLAATMNRRRQELETLVRTDMLTGLANRREFMTRLARESHRQARSGRPLSVVMFDVDHFKHVNDTWGHPMGDQVLARLGQILRAMAARSSCCCCPRPIWQAPSTWPKKSRPACASRLSRPRARASPSRKAWALRRWSRAMPTGRSRWPTATFTRPNARAATPSWARWLLRRLSPAPRVRQEPAMSDQREACR